MTKVVKEDIKWGRYLDIFDLYGKSLKIQISGKNKQSTILGSIIGMISIISIIILSSFFLVDLFNRNNIYIMYNQVKDMTPINNLTKTPILFKMLDGAGVPIDSEGIYSVEVRMMYFMRSKNTKGNVEWDYHTQKVNYTICDISKTFVNYKELQKNIPNNFKYFCIPPDTHNLTIYGKYADLSTGFTYLNFLINKCSGNNCKDKKEINDKLSNSYFSVTFLDYQIDHNNSTEAYREVFRTSALSMGPYLHKRYFYYIRQVLYDTDSAFIFEDHKKEIFYQHENYQVDVKLPEETSNINSLSDFGTLSILNDNKIDSYFRTYDKIQNLMANVGGLIKGIFIACCILNYVFTRNYSIFQISNSLFDFDEIVEYNNKKTNLKSNITSFVQNSQINLYNTVENNSFNNLNKNIITSSLNDCKKVDNKEIVKNNYVSKETTGTISNLKIDIPLKNLK